MTVIVREPEDCTTTAAASRHLSTSLARIGNHPIITGRTGWTLCGHRAYDEVAASQNRGRRVVLADMKPCGSCTRSAAKIARDAT